MIVTDFSFHQLFLRGNCSCTQAIQSPGEDKMYFNVHECTVTSEVKVLLWNNRKRSLCSDETVPDKIRKQEILLIFLFFNFYF